MKKTLALLLALLTVGSSLVACGGKPSDVTTSGDATAEPTEPVVTEEKPDLPDPASVDIAGAFNILVSGNYARNDFAADGSDGTTVEQAIYRRNQQIKETWDVEILNEDITRFGSAGGTGDGYMKIYTDYMAGDQQYDAAMIGTYDVATLAYSGYIHDLTDVPHIDLTKSWWDQKANKDLSIRGRMFYTTGDISVVDNMVTHALLFNKDMVKSYGLDNPYDLVADDNWNLETFGALVKQVGQDLDNNGVYDENDLYGLLTWNDPMTAILAAAGEKIASINDRGELTLTLYNERVSTCTTPLRASSLTRRTPSTISLTTRPARALPPRSGTPTAIRSSTRTAQSSTSTRSQPPSAIATASWTSAFCRTPS